jgi:hypothetical protein
MMTISVILNLVLSLKKKNKPINIDNNSNTNKTNLIEKFENIWSKEKEEDAINIDNNSNANNNKQLVLDKEIQEKDLKENRIKENLDNSDKDFSSQEPKEECEEIIKFKKLRDETFEKMNFYPEYDEPIEHVGIYYPQYNMRQRFKVFINNALLFGLNSIRSMKTFKYYSTSTWEDLKDKTYHSNRNKRGGA